jgi:hypothetical protein
MNPLEAPQAVADLCGRIFGVIGLFCALLTAPLEAQWWIESMGSGQISMSLSGQVPDDAFATLLTVACVPRTPPGVARTVDPVILVLALGGGLARFDGKPITTVLDSTPTPMFAWRADSAGELATLYEGSGLVAALAQAETLRVGLSLLIDRQVDVAFALGNFSALYESRLRPMCRGAQ